MQHLSIPNLPVRDGNWTPTDFAWPARPMQAQAYG